MIALTPEAPGTIARGFVYEYATATLAGRYPSSDHASEGLALASFRTPTVASVSN